MFHILHEKCRDIGVGDLASDKSLADATGQNKGELAGFGLLVLAHDADKVLRRRQPAWNFRGMDGQADALEMAGDTVSRAAGAKLQPFGKAEGLDHADGDAFAMKKPAGITGGRFQGVTESVAEIEQGARTGLGFILGDDAGLGLAGLADGMDPGLGIAAQDLTGRTLQPDEEILVAEQPVFRHFGIA